MNRSKFYFPAILLLVSFAFTALSMTSYADNYYQQSYKSYQHQQNQLLEQVQKEKAAEKAHETKRWQRLESMVKQNRPAANQSTQQTQKKPQLLRPAPKYKNEWAQPQKNIQQWTKPEKNPWAAQPVSNNNNQANGKVPNIFSPNRGNAQNSRSVNGSGINRDIYNNQPYQPQIHRNNNTNNAPMPNIFYQHHSGTNER